jgi:glyoxylase-like metal-dependent hydrolase (beta-lactamase superfamily II)
MDTTTKHLEHRGRPTGSRQFRGLTGLLGLAALLGIACGDDGGDPSPQTGTETDAGTVTSDGSATTSDPTASTTSTSEGSTGATTGETTGGQDDALDRIYAFLGGRDALANLSGFELVLDGDRYVPGEGYGTDDPALPANTFAATVSADLEGDRLRVATERTLQFLFAGTEQSVTEIIDGDLGYIDGLESIFGFPSGDMLSDRWAAVRRQQFLLNPHLPLRAALDGLEATVVGSETLEGTTYDVVEIEDAVAPLRIYADPLTGAPRRLHTLENDHLHRDVELVVTWDDWQDNGVTAFPAHVTLSRAGALLLDEARTEVTVDPQYDDASFSFPPDADPVFVAEDADRGLHSHQFHLVFASIGIPQDGVQGLVTPIEVAPGIHQLAGGSHHSMVVEQEEGLVLVEAPLYPERSRALLAWAADQYPDKPITHLVVSHFHEDHSAGAREIVAHGAALIVGENAETFWEHILEAPSTIVPDALAENPTAVTTVLVPEGGTLVLDDPLRPVTVYSVANTHAEDLVMTVADDAGVAFIADIYSPGFPPFGPGPAELYASIVEHQLDDDITAIVGSHGFEIHTLEQLEDALGGR